MDADVVMAACADVWSAGRPESPLTSLSPLAALEKHSPLSFTFVSVHSTLPKDRKHSNHNSNNNSVTLKRSATALH